MNVQNVSDKSLSNYDAKKSVAGSPSCSVEDQELFSNLYENGQNQGDISSEKTFSSENDDLQDPLNDEPLMCSRGQCRLGDAEGAVQTGSRGAQSNLQAQAAGERASLTPAADKRTSQANAADVRTYQANAADVRTSQANAADVRTYQANAADVRTSQANAADVRTYQANASDVRTSQAQAADARASQTQAADVRTSQANAADVRTYQANASDVRTSQAQAADARASQTQAADARASQAQAADARASQTQAADARASQTQAADERASQAQAADERDPKAQAADGRDPKAQAADGRDPKAQAFDESAPKAQGASQHENGAEVVKTAQAQGEIHELLKARTQMHEKKAEQGHTIVHDQQDADSVKPSMVLPSADTLLVSLFGQQPAEAAGKTVGADPIFHAEMEKLVERILVADKSQGAQEVRISLADGPLKGSDLSIVRTAEGQLHITVNCQTATAFQTAVSARQSLVDALEAHGEQVRVNVDNGGGNEGDSRQRSRGYRAIVDEESDEA